MEPKSDVHNPGAMEPMRPTSLHKDIIQPKTATEKGNMNGLSNAPNTICVTKKYSQTDQKKLRTLVKEY